MALYFKVQMQRKASLPFRISRDNLIALYMGYELECCFMSRCSDVRPGPRAGRAGQPPWAPADRGPQDLAYTMRGLGSTF